METLTVKEAKELLEKEGQYFLLKWSDMIRFQFMRFSID